MFLFVAMNNYMRWAAAIAKTFLALYASSQRIYITIWALISVTYVHTAMHKRHFYFFAIFETFINILSKCASKVRCDFTLFICLVI